MELNERVARALERIADALEAEPAAETAPPAPPPPPPPRGGNQITCSTCGKVDSVNFTPRGDRPILCGDCFRARQR